MELSTQLGLLAGAALAVVGELRALRSLGELKRLMAFSALAQAGYILVGLSLGAGGGSAGALTHLLYQAAARAVWYLTLRSFADSKGDWSLNGLRGMGSASPANAALLGFALFAAIGVTPLGALPGKTLIIYAAVAGGHWLTALALAFASVMAALYTIRVVHAVCMETSKAEPAHVSAGILPMLLAGALALASLFPAPLLHLIGGASLPELEGAWPAAALIPYVGAFAVFLAGCYVPSVRNILIGIVTTATVAAAWPQAGAAPIQHVFTMLYALGGGVVALYSIGYMGRKKGSDRYFFFLFVMIATLIGLASAEDFGGFYGFWELMTFSSYMLVVHKPTHEALKAGAKYFVMCAGGAYFMQIGLLALHAAAPHAGIGQMGAALQAFGPVSGLALLLLAGFAVKAGFFPLHAWLPAAHPVAPSSISAPLSGLLTKAGVLGVALIVPVLAGQAGGHWILTLVTLMAAVTFILGELMALTQSDVKRMLAYSTLAQIGEIGLVLCLGTWAATVGALSHVVNHAVMKDLLFLAAGGLIMRAGTQRIDGLKGLGKAMPVTGACMAVGLVSIMGLPPMGGFFSKFLMLQAAMAAGQTWIAALVLIGSLIGCVYYGRLIKVLFFSPYEGQPVEEMPLTMRLAVGGLAALALVSGLIPSQWTSLVIPAATALFPASVGALPDISINWTLPVVLPLAGAAAAIFLRKDMRLSGKAATVGLALGLIALMVHMGDWGSLQWTFALLVLGLGVCNMAYSTGYMTHSHTGWRFFAVFSVMVAGLVGLCSTSSLIAFFCFWEIMSSWPLFFAIIHEESPSALKEGTKYFLFNIAGASFLFLGILCLGHVAGGFGFDAVNHAVTTLPATTWLPGLCLAGIGMLMKAAMLPVRIDYQMHPATAPTPVSGYISAMLLKSAPFGLMLARFVWAGGVSGDSAAALNTAMHIGVWIGGITILYAAVKALVQTGIKEMLIYSTVSQLGYIVVGVCLGTTLGVTGGLLHLFNHMLFKDLAFLCAGALMFATHAHNLEELGGVGRKMPVTLLCFCAALFSIAGMPPFNGFNSKLVIYYALIERGEMVLAIIAILSSVITLAYFLKFMHGAFFGQMSAAAERAHEVGPAMRIPIVILSVLCLLTGIFPGLALIPIAGIEQALNIQAPQVALSGITSGYGAFDMTLLSFMIIVVGGGVWLGVSRLTGRVRRTAIHTCGETSVDHRFTHVGAGDLYAAPLQILARMTKGHFALKRFGGHHE
ncbi:proton-conducting transporter membrane subunit [Fundidesulfovibrio terrae]|uniref:proton-conducting transporter transmembrane domain-containing protein n=1 Tax=Fundidesulfovibrio terrae TaxID=2922866 RepID=UPI001FAECF16|nr:proton-conducting transporter membrane subunit [Fundidesulfovibrio terrae]